MPASLIRNNQLPSDMKAKRRGQRHSNPKTVGFCIFCPNLVVLAWMDFGWGWHTRTCMWTDRQMQSTIISEGQKWSWVKKYWLRLISCLLTPWGSWSKYVSCHKSKSKYPMNQISTSEQERCTLWPYVAMSSSGMILTIKSIISNFIFYHYNALYI